MFIAEFKSKLCWGKRKEKKKEMTPRLFKNAYSTHIESWFERCFLLAWDTWVNKQPSIEIYHTIYHMVSCQDVAMATWKGIWWMNFVPCPLRSWIDDMFVVQVVKVMRTLLPGTWEIIMLKIDKLMIEASNLVSY